jgi:hypothetical protein
MRVDEDEVEHSEFPSLLVWEMADVSLGVEIAIGDCAAAVVSGACKPWDSQNLVNAAASATHARR